MSLEINDRNHAAIVTNECVIEKSNLIARGGEADIADISGSLIEDFAGGIFQAKLIADASGDR